MAEVSPSYLTYDVAPVCWFIIASYSHRTLDDLELCKEYLPQIQRIKALRKEIDAVRENREEIEKQTRVIVKMKSMVKTQVKFFQEKFKKEKLRCGVLESEIQKHPFVETLISH